MLPGFVNSHHHVGLTPLQLGTPDLPLELWIVARLGEYAVDPYLDTLYSAFEMIASGVTTVAHINGGIPGGFEAGRKVSAQILSAYRSIGMRASYSIMTRDQNHLVYEDNEAFCARLPADLGRELSKQLKHQSLSPKDALTLFDTLHKDNAGQRLTRVQLAPANLHWCSDDTLVALNERSAQVGVPMHMHLLETNIQKEYASRRTGGKTAVRHLHDLGILSPRLTLGHGVWLTEEDIELLAETDTCVCHNCSSNFRLRSGIAPLNALEAKGIGTAIGIDEAGLNDDRDMLQEMRLVLRAHRVPGLDAAEVPTVPQIVRMATEGGARTTAFQQEIGRLEPGRSFDAVLIDWEEATYPYQDSQIPMLDALIQRANAKAVDAVYVDGEKIFEDGRFLKVDREAVLAEISKELTRPRPHDDLARAALARKITSYGRKFYEDYLRGDA
jgi:cytosine/adenosine deaminase-related metal-dependent hydrolase